MLTGHPECVQLLLKAKASVSEDCDGCPCLHLAVCWGALHPTSVTQAVVQALLEAGSDPLQRCVLRSVQ
jgi:Ankyrin repeat